MLAEWYHIKGCYIKTGAVLHEPIEQIFPRPFRCPENISGEPAAFLVNHNRLPDRIVGRQYNDRWGWIPVCGTHQVGNLQRLIPTLHEKFILTPLTSDQERLFIDGFGECLICRRTGPVWKIELKKPVFTT